MSLQEINELRQQLENERRLREDTEQETLVGRVFL